MERELNFESRSDERPILFMFVRRNDSRYIIHKIDALSSYQLCIREAEMLPLLVFRHGTLPECECAFAYIKPYFYIVGEDKRDVFTLKKNDLVNLGPSKNSRGAGYVSRVSAPMSGDKSSPLAFAYKNNLSVLSKARSTLPKYETDFIYDEFEIYSPSKESWSALGSKPLRDCDVQSYVVIGTMVYFTTSLHVVISFSLERGHWGTIYDPYGVTYIHKNSAPNSSKYVSPPTFEQQIHVIQNRIFGSVYGDARNCFNIWTSSSKPSAKSFLRPFFDDECALYYCSCRMDKQSSLCSSHMVTINEEIMCGVCYGVDFSREDPSNYVVLTFFKVPEDSQSSPSNRVGVTSDSLFSLEEDEKRSNCFKFESLHSTRLLIKTKQPTLGVISSCIFV